MAAIFKRTIQCLTQTESLLNYTRTANPDEVTRPPSTGEYKVCSIFQFPVFILPVTYFLTLINFPLERNLLDI